MPRLSLPIPRGFQSKASNANFRFQGNFWISIPDDAGIDIVYPLRAHLFLPCRAIVLTSSAFHPPPQVSFYCLSLYCNRPCPLRNVPRRRGTCNSAPKPPETRGQNRANYGNSVASLRPNFSTTFKNVCSPLTALLSCFYTTSLRRRGIDILL
ncbi:hypothetical protein BCR34DRAFT_561222 [Clohesyomyces aquaticus]|uniref:Uncharacterized protein n=1 Tax=Clohesyomyces aquaticus TaxID=1231657 RepID=A0A1Y1ZUH5_9PLEO|nr:hypothetical protein BCR34DRAFT_561222 [Clohesyomyces aquaticus]